MKLSKIIHRQIPAFIREDHPLFVTFIKKYYEFLETTFEKIGNIQGSSSKDSPLNPLFPTNLKGGEYYLVTKAGYFLLDERVVYAKAGNIIAFTKSGKAYLRLSENSNAFLEKELTTGSHLQVLIDAISNELSYTLPKSLVEQQFFLQRIKDLYVSKGSEESFRYLFRVLFDKEIELFYPSSSVLRTSDGNWVQSYSIFVRTVVGNPFILVRNQADVISRRNKVSINIISAEERTQVGYFLPSLDLGFVRESVEAAIELGYTEEDVDKILDAYGIGYESYSNTVYECFIDREFFGSFGEDDIIICTDAKGNLFIGYILSTTAKTKVYSGGVGFRVGDIIPVSSSLGTGTILKVSDISANGQISTVDFLKFGYEYSRPIVISASKDGTSRLVLEERAEKDDDPNFVTSATFEDATGGFISRGYTLDNMDYSFDDGVVFNYQVVNGGTGYTNATVSFTASSGETTQASATIDYDVLDELSGYLYKTANSSLVTGENTKFLTELQPNDLIRFKSGNVARVASIQSDTQLTLTTTNAFTSRRNMCQKVNGYISGIEFDTKGYGYTSPPNVLISGDGQNAQIVSYIGKDIYWDLDYCGEVINSFKYNRTKFVPDATENALIRLYPGSIAKYPGYYQSNKGFLSDTICLQDGRYYQDFSYVIKSSVEMEKYESYVKTTIHPAGMMLFGEYTIENNISIENDLNIVNQFRRTFGINVTDSVGTSDTNEFTDFVYSHTQFVIDSFGATDYGVVVDDPYTLPYTPYTSRMWEDYTQSDVFLEFGND